MKLIKQNKERQVITYICLVLLVFSIFAYMYFLTLSVVHVVMRKDTLREITQLRSDIAFLESSYIEANYKISQKAASADEFIAVKDKIFIGQTFNEGLVLRTPVE